MRHWTNEKHFLPAPNRIADVEILVIVAGEGDPRANSIMDFRRARTNRRVRGPPGVSTPRGPLILLRRQPRDVIRWLNLIDIGHL